MQVLVGDTCGDDDCDGCCTRGAKGAGGFLIDMEVQTLARYYPDTDVDSGVATTPRSAICWKDLSVPPTPPGPTPTPRPPTNWTKHKGYNCYPGAGGSSVDPDDKPISQKTVAECGNVCASTSGCNAFTVDEHQAPVGPCWLRKSIKLSDCDTRSGYDTYDGGSPLPPTPPPLPPGPVPNTSWPAHN
jgi:hypothetical protein